jgi:heat shock protein HslJ
MKRYLLLLLLAGLVLSACTSQEKSLTGIWTLTAYGPEGSTNPAVTDNPATITFNDDGTVSGNSGCNSFGGEYKVEGGQVTFNQLASTLMACSDPLMSQEGGMFKVLDGTAAFEIKGDTLTITKDGMALLFAAAEGK